MIVQVLYFERENVFLNTERDLSSLLSITFTHFFVLTTHVMDEGTLDSATDNKIPKAFLLFVMVSYAFSLLFRIP